MKRFLIVCGLICIIILVVMGVNFITIEKKEQNINEIIPEEEISENQMRETTITLYFEYENNLVPEIRRIDVKELMNNPYEVILTMLLDGSENKKYNNYIPINTIINKIEKKQDILFIEINNENIEIENNEKIIYEEIKKTMIELNEINNINLKINNKEIN